MKIDRFLIGTVVFDILVIILESVNDWYDRYTLLFLTIEILVVSVFTLEFALRLWVGKISYALSGFGIIDLIAILPFYLALMTGQSFTAIGLFQLFRLLRILKLGRYFRQWEVFIFVLKRKKTELKTMLYFVAMMLILSSGLMYILENPYQPHKFTSIPAAMWWSIVTMTTVGYGDLIPVTTAGKIIASFTALMGIVIVALPTVILGSGFIEHMFSSPEIPKKCPRCKHSLIPHHREHKTWLMRLFSK